MAWHRAVTMGVATFRTPTITELVSSGFHTNPVSQKVCDVLRIKPVARVVVPKKGKNCIPPARRVSLSSQTRENGYPCANQK
jgi:hypothetical protein